MGSRLEAFPSSLFWFHNTEKPIGIIFDFSFQILFFHSSFFELHVMRLLIQKSQLKIISLQTWLQSQWKRDFYFNASPLPFQTMSGECTIFDGFYS